MDFYISLLSGLIVTLMHECCIYDCSICVGAICIYTHCIHSESQLSISRPCLAMGNTVCLFNSFPQHWEKDAISVEATYILVNTVSQFSIVIQSHESSLPPLEKNKRNSKKYWWELSPLKLRSNNLPILSFMHDRTLMPQIQYTTPEEVHYSWTPAVFVTLSIN